MAENKKKIVEGFKDAYDSLPDDRGLRVQFRRMLSDKLKVSDRTIYNYINGTRPMSVYEWSVIVKELKEFGVELTQSREQEKKRKLHTVAIEHSEYFDIIEAAIDNAVIDMWNGETRTITVDEKDTVFEIELSVIVGSTGETIVSSLDIEGGADGVEYNFRKLYDKIFNKKYN